MSARLTQAPFSVVGMAPIITLLAIALVFVGLGCALSIICFLQMQKPNVSGDMKLLWLVGVIVGLTPFAVLAVGAVASFLN